MYILLFNSCIKISRKDLHALLKYEQKWEREEVVDCVGDESLCWCMLWLVTWLDWQLCCVSSCIVSTLLSWSMWHSHHTHTATLHVSLSVCLSVCVCVCVYTGDACSGELCTAVDHPRRAVCGTLGVGSELQPCLPSDPPTCPPDHALLTDCWWHLCVCVCVCVGGWVKTGLL